MIYHPTTPQEAVALRREHRETSVYLAGGTDDLRLHSPATGKDLVDINGLGFDTIQVKDGKVYIGARVTLQQLVECAAVPAFIREAAGFCANFIRRNSATVGGNVAARRQDSYLAAALTAADAVLVAETADGEKEKAIGEYLLSDCKCFLKYIVVDAERQGFVKRFGRTASTHATLIAAESNGVYALSVHGSALVYGDSAAVYEKATYVDDLEGSAAYKKYLASIVFENRG